MGVLPLSAPGGAFARIGSGAVSGVAGGEAGRVVNNAVLPDQMQAPLSAEELALQAVTGSVLAIGGPRGANAARLHAARVESAKRASQGAALLGQLNKLAAASKVRARDPAQAQAFFQSVLDEGRDSVWITPKALAESGLSERIIAEIPGVAEQVRTAADIQHDIRLPVADLVARLAGPELEQGILPHVSTEPGGFTAKTAEAYYQTGAAMPRRGPSRRVPSGSRRRSWRTWPKLAGIRGRTMSTPPWCRSSTRSRRPGWGQRQRRCTTITRSGSRRAVGRERRLGRTRHSTYRPMPRYNAPSSKGS
jgi:hypothetical protein